MKILMVSPFPPLRDGIGKYAAQEVAALRREGHEVEVLAPMPCAAHYVVDFKAGRGLVQLREYARNYDRVILQYHPAHYHSRGAGLPRVRSNLSMLRAFRSIPNLEIVCHEVDYPPDDRSGRPEFRIERAAWRAARHVEFHTQHEVSEMERHFGVLPQETKLREHGRYFAPAVEETKEEARRRLGRAPDLPLLLCIGFIQSHKGFDRAIRVFRRVPGDARLVVIGSIREEIPEHRAHFHDLVDLAVQDDRVQIDERTLSDEEFDRWIIASDVVLLPYREIWSSGVLERAHTLGRPVIASNVGGMGEQAREGDVIVSSDDELAEAMASFVGEGAPTAPEVMTADEAMAFVEEEASKRRDPVARHGTDRALEILNGVRGVQAYIVPSARPVIGRFLDLGKRVARRGLGWLLTPMLGQINEFERYSAEAMEAVVSEMRGTDAGAYSNFNYAAFEAKFRGRSENIKEMQRAYLADFARGGPILDVGCGRGEFLELLREAGVDAVGVDLSADMIAIARSKGLDAHVGDGIAFLRSLPPGSLGGVMAAQVVEHLKPRSLVDFLVAAQRALRPDGIIVCETINPQSLYALANWYTMDLTHAQPVHPGTLSFLAEQVGFKDVRVRYLSPAKPPAPPLTVDDDAPAWAHGLAKRVEEELKAINDIVSGPQDYALIAHT